MGKIRQQDGAVYGTGLLRRGFQVRGLVAGLSCCLVDATTFEFALHQAK